MLDNCKLIVPLAAFNIYRALIVESLEEALLGVGEGFQVNLKCSDNEGWLNSHAEKSFNDVMPTLVFSAYQKPKSLKERLK